VINRLGETLLHNAMKDTPPSLDIRTLRQQVQSLGLTLRWHGSQWLLCGRETEPLGHSIKTERDALEFVLNRQSRKTEDQGGSAH
jgi:hypothetical protein